MVNHVSGGGAAAVSSTTRSGLRGNRFSFQDSARRTATESDEDVTRRTAATLASKRARPEGSDLLQVFPRLRRQLRRGPGVGRRRDPRVRQHIVGTHWLVEAQSQDNWIVEAPAFPVRLSSNRRTVGVVNESSNGDSSARPATLVAVASTRTVNVVAKGSGVVASGEKMRVLVPDQ